MSGHSKWHSIKHKKSANDAARGKIFTRHARLITIAARDGGGDPADNPNLATAIANARAENMPNLNIERAIKKGTGADKDAAQLLEMSFEGYAAGGVAVLVSVISDNKNRTVASVRAIFKKFGGNLGENGSVAWIFETKARFEIAAKSNAEEIELKMIDAGADDISETDGNLEIIAPPENFAEIKTALQSCGAEILVAKIEKIPQNSVEISDEKTAKNILNLLNALDDDDDVSGVIANFEIDDAILQKVSG
jgi:YebC/PmpR family DNA-binding regulatory protein